MTRSIFTLIEDEIDNKYYITTLGGYINYIKPSIVKQIIPDLIEFCELYTDDEIDAINKFNIEHFYNHSAKAEISPIKLSSSKRPAGYVYVLKCANTYKIGYSKDVERRIKQLDTRPFKLELIAKYYSDVAYSVEQRLHTFFSEYKLDGEWYSDKLPIDTISELIKKFEGELK